MIQQIKRYFFYMVVDDFYEDWEDFWKRKDYQGYLAFRAYSQQEEEWGVLTKKQRKQALANYTESRGLTNSDDKEYLTGTASEFDIKYLIWDNLL